ncbi:protein-L-isoaspartate(D-aspartate) O-methyltransferase [Paramicrobacterium chengjingii]|uniref:protein-L-isoaspartate(D-aspartate) O-methyltransferase n=1 Tax=Paramicrobacterium chengjingii TaxID=2769067 RepID=UPI0014210E49|nr:protein-L-isoaspartate(D-aspartate) O-methyltransferase [Microbacterium chengjingii]
MGNEHEQARERMLRDHLVPRGITNVRVLAAMGAVPRELFVPENLRESAYADHPLPLGNGQTISQPYVVALTVQEADIGSGDIVLDVGTGSGYAAAVASRIATRVVSIERIAELSERAEAVLRALGYDNIELLVGDGTQGATEHGPYDAIISAAAAERIPTTWTEQLAPHGRIIAPIGGRNGQRLRSVQRDSESSYIETDLGGVRFVPLISDG